MSADPRPDERTRERVHAMRSAMWPNIHWYEDNDGGPEWDLALAVLDRFDDLTDHLRGGGSDVG